MNIIRFASLGLLATALAACAATPRVSPVEVTRFHAPATLTQLGAGTIFIENAPGEDSDSQDLAPYKSAVAAELAKLGYSETSRSEAGHIAQVRVARYADKPERKRSPVSVGVGGGTGSYGSGVGLGIGINLGGGSREMIGTDLSVMIRDKQSSDVLWEGRSSLSVSDNSQFADSSPNASAIAGALFREFPGNNGETVEVKVAN